MLSFVEHVVLVTESQRSRDERKSRSRSGGPGSDDDEKARHRRDVHGLRSRYHAKKGKHRSSEEEGRERKAYRHARKGLQKRLNRSLGGHSAQ